MPTFLEAARDLRVAHSRATPAVRRGQESDTHRAVILGACESWCWARAGPTRPKPPSCGPRARSATPADWSTWSTWTRYAGPLARRAIRYRTESFEPDFVLLTRHAILAGESDLRAILRDRKAPSGTSTRSRGRRCSRWAAWWTDVPHVSRAGRALPRRGHPRGAFPVRRGWIRSRPRPRDPRRPSSQCDASFVGAGQYPHRYGVLRAVAAAVDCRSAAPAGTRRPRTCRSPADPCAACVCARSFAAPPSRSAPTRYPEQDADRASASNRMWKILGCGGFYLGAVRAGHRGVRRSTGATAPGTARPTKPRPAHGTTWSIPRSAGASRRRGGPTRSRITPTPGDSSCCWRAGSYELGHVPSDERVVPELEHPNAGQPLDRP